ncbi:MAG: DNA polymerase III subunit delta' [Anaerovibrio sp.]|uniref:DNA polymerase III subunit delta' n=1 Tax=Anaerovibrio sp. TaxID=1872532 RepID=UPI0025D15108|nr:DNA polymerase III subunit delta' [Anaerovibrio sp.]MCR5177169.1 DNA polymerase III subunit delta' [Anaerovibrio sp.]
MNIFWKNIIGHERNIDRLKLLCSEDRVPHSMLFCGIQGIGKRLVAESMAAAILCHNPIAGTACGECPSCKALMADIHPDFFQVQPEVKKGSELIKIEAIREMQEKISRMPVVSKQRVVIIDDAQTMNDAAANCLLKTIEEPGGQIYFILITNSVMAMLTTIISRCMREDFGGLESQDVVKVLVQKGIDDKQASYLAGFADGSVGQGLLLNDEEGSSLHNSAMKFFTACAQSVVDMELAWMLGRELGEKDKGQLQQWFGFFIMLLRDQLVLYSGSDIILYNQMDMGRLGNLAGGLSQRKLLAILKLAREYQGRLRYSVNNRLLAESFIVRVKDIVED